MTSNQELVIIALVALVLALCLILTSCSNLDGLRHLPELSRMLRA